MRDFCMCGALLPSATKLSTRQFVCTHGDLQDGENILRKWSRYLMSAALGRE